MSATPNRGVLRRYGLLPTNDMEHPYLPGRQETTPPLPVHATALLRQARDFVDGLASVGEAWRGAHPFTVLRRGHRNVVVRARVAVDGSPTLVLKLAGDEADLADTDLRHMLALSGLGVVPDVVAEHGEARGFAMVDAGDDTLTRVLEQGTPGRYSRAWPAWPARMPAFTWRGAPSSPGPRRCAPVASPVNSATGPTDCRGPSNGCSCRTRIRACGGRSRASSPPGMPIAGPSRSRTSIRRRATCSSFRRAARPLVDFEYGAARHPAYDLAAWDVLCPLPNDFVQGLTREYAAARAALGWPVSTDDDSYVAVVAYRALALLAWLPREARERDCPWVDAWSARQAVLSTLDRLAVRCTGDTALHTLAEAAREASARWRRTWPDVTEVLPPWPALRGALA
ncbi:MAG: hypothetical protein IPF47_02740 [Gemmatimonadetes bacterium]|nr:hypothetical protein [Gemmatimonadota bacterium]